MNRAMTRRRRSGGAVEPLRKMLRRRGRPRRPVRPVVEIIEGEARDTVRREDAEQLRPVLDRVVDGLREDERAGIAPRALAIHLDDLCIGTLRREFAETFRRRDRLDLHRREIGVGVGRLEVRFRTTVDASRIRHARRDDVGEQDRDVPPRVRRGHREDVLRDAPKEREELPQDPDLLAEQPVERRIAVRGHRDLLRMLR